MRVFADTIFRLGAALAFLTRIPVGRGHSFGAPEVGKGSVMFPVVGLGLGVLQLFPLWFAHSSVPAAVSAFAAVALLAMATGAMHLDAVADFFDGFGGGRTRDDVLRIMRDHAIGAYGGTAMVLAITGRMVFLAAIFDAGHVGTVVAACVLSRWTATLLGWRLAYARQDSGGLGAAITDHVGVAEAVGATVIAWALVFCFACTPHTIVLGATTIVVMVAFWVACLRRIGGVTGDTLGASIEVADIAALGAVALCGGGVG